MDLTKVFGQQALISRQCYFVAKRAMDLCLCLLALPVLLPLLGVIWVVVRLDSPGRPLFVQERIGRGGRPFRMYKFRTMQAKLDEAVQKAYLQAYAAGQICGEKSPGGTYKPIFGGELTRVGPFLRRSSLDELPQVLNVLKGEMSLVGPRPNVPWQVEEYEPWHRRRLEVLPGLTGLAQVRGRSTISFDEIVAHDLEYIERQCLGLDLVILLQTAATVLRSEGAE